MNIGTRIFTLFNGRRVGRDRYGNSYYEMRRAKAGARIRRWVDYAGVPDASKVPPEWHAWLHHTTAAPLSELARRPWWKPHQPNLTGTSLAYRPAGHDYSGGVRAAATGDYEAWSPGLPAPVSQSAGRATASLVDSRAAQHGSPTPNATTGHG